MLDAGVAFLAKPFTLDQLAAKVRQVLDKRGLSGPARWICAGRRLMCASRHCERSEAIQG